MSKTGRNVVNVKYIDDYCQTLTHRFTEMPHITRWILSTFRRALLNSAPAQPVIDKAVLDHPVIKSLLNLTVQSGELLKDMVDDDTDTCQWSSIINQKRFTLVRQHARLTKGKAYLAITVDDTTPQWLVKALAEQKPLWNIYEFSTSMLLKHVHMLDYLRRLPERDITMTYKQLQSLLISWNLKLKQQKRLTDSALGSREIHLPCLENTRFKLMELGTKEAFSYEGSTMKHCVADYWRHSFHWNALENPDARSSFYEDVPLQILDYRLVRVWSLRERDTERSRVTIETKGREIVQRQGRANSEIPDSLRGLVKRVEFDLVEWLDRIDRVIVQPTRFTRGQFAAVQVHPRANVLDELPPPTPGSSLNDERGWPRAWLANDGVDPRIREAELQATFDISIPEFLPKGPKHVG